MGGWVWRLLSALLVFHGRSSQVSPLPPGQGTGDRDSYTDHGNAKGVVHYRVLLRSLSSLGGFGKIWGLFGRCNGQLNSWVLPATHLPAQALVLLSS